ncbi:BatD family protein [Methylosoma difficile]
MTAQALLPAAYGAEIAASLSRNPVALDESFQIVFTANDNPDGAPDFSPLEENFTILHRNHTSSASWINGKASKTVQWQVDVIAKQSGELNIPAIAFGRDRSNAISVTVTSSNSSGGSNEDLFIEVETNTHAPYVQSQVLYTLRVLTRVEIARAQLQEPELPDAVIEKLGEDANYNKQINGVDYSVTERRYAIFPQKSGKISIKPVVLTAEVLAESQRSINSFFNSQMTQTKRVQSQAIDLEVKPAPAAFTGKHWLSAQQLELKQQWSGDVSKMKAGEPLTRTLTLLAKGTTVGQLPELNSIVSNNDLKAYSDQPVLSEQKLPDGLLAVREEKIALIPSKAGDYHLPAVEIAWFNTDTQQLETAKLPEVTLTASGAVAAVTPPQSANIAPPVASGVTPAPINQAAPVAVNATPATATYWPWLCGFLATGWLLTIVYFVSKRAAPKPETAPIPKQLRLQDSVKALKQACATNDAQAAKTALLAWGQQLFGCSSLGALAPHCEARLRDEILLLNQTLYSKDNGQWQGKKLFQTFSENKARAKLAEQEDSALEPLYRL